MRKTILILFLLFAGLIFVISCQGGGPGFPGSGNGKGGSYFGGTPNGLEIKFLNLQPPDILREGQDFTVALELTNNGQCDAIGQICVRDALSDIFGGIQDNCQEMNLKAIENINGQIVKDSRTFYFRGNSYNNIGRELSTQILAKTSYKCEFVSGPQLCVKSVIGENENLCKSIESISGKELKARSAPITISKVDKELVPEANGVRLIATITLSKMSKGQLKAEKEVDFTKGSPMFISVEYSGFGEMKCSELEGNLLYWKSKDTSKIVQCELELGKIDLIQNPLNIKLAYDYEITEVKQITIKEKFSGRQETFSR